MIKYALVGNIASGKSTAEKFLKNNGYAVADSDEIAHDLLDDNQSVIEVFKDYDILENNKISRKKLGQTVFSSTELKRKLEDILHPLIKKEINEFFKLHENEESVFVSVPLLFEANMETMFDKIIFIYTDDNIRLKRLIQRNNLTEKEAKLRMDSQMNQQDKVKKSDIVIYNNSTIEEFEKQISTLFG